MQDLPTFGEEQIMKEYAPKLQKGDVLTISVSSTDNIGIAPFNVYVNDSDLSQEIAVSRQRLINYTLRSDGSIEFPVLGKLEIAGMTTLELTNYLKTRLKEYLKEPIVSVEWLNFKYTVLGEVSRPGQYNASNERTSILDALGSAGDITMYANRKDIRVIREEDGERKFYSLDLTKSDFIQSDVYYINQNDVILVGPNNAQVQSSAYNRNTPIFISIASLVVSVIVLLTR